MPVSYTHLDVYKRQRYYNLPLVQLLYAGDDVSGAQWMPRDWDRQQNVRANLIAAALKLAEKL